MAETGRDALAGDAPRSVSVGSVEVGADALVLIAGPCVIESREHTLEVAGRLGEECAARGVPLIFKASCDKANRSSVDSYRGPGMEEGLDILADVRRQAGVPVLSDVHEVHQVESAARVLDVLQIPAFLCRQTDLLTAAAATGKPVNVKKGQFMAPLDMRHAVAKIASCGNRAVMLTERGTTFGYNNLVVDFRALALMRELGCPVVFDATHSVQLPGAGGGASGGERRFVAALARAAVAFGVDALFIETHEQPDRALCDGPNSWPLDRMGELLESVLAVRRIAGSGQGGG